MAIKTPHTSETSLPKERGKKKEERFSPLSSRPSLPAGREGAKTRAPAPDAAALLRAARVPVARARPAALAWREASLPGIGTLSTAGWLPAMLLAFAAVALVYLVQTSGVATTGYDIQDLQRQQKEWQLRNEQLRLELDKLQSLTWVESEATGKLGMQRPDKVVYVQMPPGSSWP